MIRKILIIKLRVPRISYESPESIAAYLGGAYLSDADLTSSLYQPIAEKHPLVDYIAEAKGLSDLTYNQPRALVNLRELFKDGDTALRKGRSLTPLITFVQSDY